MTKNEYISFRRDGVAGSPVVIAFHGTGGNEHQFTGLIEQILPDAGMLRRAATSRNSEPIVSSVAPAKASMIWMTFICAPKKCSAL